ncbi:MAG TPA: thioredoxin domain-containing protein [Candidatus Paceibacterota bacterium]|nr:thioredoxin domain-containing protein [Candidatus Paceibacterota bacterium]
MNGKRITLWLIVILLVGGAIWGVMRAAKNSASTGTGDLAVAVSETDWKTGSANPKVVLVEYADFECPACAAYHPVVKQMVAEFPNDLQFVYRHFPLKQIHQHAELAAVVAEAAGKQGKFWEMHDILMTRQSEWAGNRTAQGFFVGYIQSLGLDLDKFKADLADREIKKKISDSYNSGVRSGVQGTPTFFLNGERLVSNPRNPEEFRTLIKAAIAGGATSTPATTMATSSVTR